MATVQWRDWLERLNPPAYGRRQPLVLINGLAEQAESWFRNHWFWRRYFEVHMPNILAYEGAALHRRIEAGLVIDIDYLVGQLHVYLDSFVQTPPYHLVASSLGGKVAVEYAVRYPEQVARLVLLCPSGMGEEERLPVVEGVRRNDTHGLVDSVFYDRRQADPRLLAYYQKRFANRRWRSGLMRTIRGTMDHCVRDQMAHVTQPTLFVVGREDRIVDPCEAERAAPAGPGPFPGDSAVRTCAATGKAVADQPSGHSLPDQSATANESAAEPAGPGPSLPGVMS